MIALAQLQTELRRHCKDLAPGASVSVRSWKGDRGFAIERDGDGYLVHEDGFVRRSVHCPDLAALLKECKRIARREFPRSNKLRFDHS